MSRRTTAVATWETGCSTCPTPICPGDRIVLTDTGWAHQDCRHDMPVPESTDVCPDCHEQRALSGACSCPE